MVTRFPKITRSSPSFFEGLYWELYMVYAKRCDDLRKIVLF